MFPRVTAVLVVRHGGDHLQRTLDAIRSQDRVPDALLVVLAQAGKSDYVVQKAIVTTPHWRIAGPLRVGTAARSALKGLKPKELPSDGELEFAGDTASIRVNLARGRVLDFEYSCSAS